MSYDRELTAEELKRLRDLRLAMVQYVQLLSGSDDQLRAKLHGLYAPTPAEIRELLDRIRHALLRAGEKLEDLYDELGKLERIDLQAPHQSFRHTDVAL